MYRAVFRPKRITVWRMTDKSENGPGPMPRPFEDVLASLSFFTRLPVRPSAQPLAGAGYCFPLVGAAVGVLGSLALLAAGTLGLSPWIGGFLALTVTAVMTGALHEDGLADTADGLASGRSAQARLDIMRDSRTGAFGVLALILATGLKVAALASLAHPAAAALALIAAHAGARGVLPLVMVMMPTASKDGMAAQAGKPSFGMAAAAAAVGSVLVLALLSPRSGLAAIAAVAAAVWVMCWLARRLFGGYNGDVLGAIEQVAEIGILVAAASGGNA